MSRQYMLVVDEKTLPLLMQTITGLQFLEVQGLDMQGNPNYKVLVSPCQPQLNEVPLNPPETTAEEAPPEKPKKRGGRKKGSKDKVASAKK